MKPFIRNHFTAHDRKQWDPETGEVIDHSFLDSLFYEEILEPSLTVPDQALTVKQILDRHARGLPLGGERVAIYEPDSDLPDPRRLDLAERQELAEQYAAELVEIEEKRKKTKQLLDDAEAARREKIEAEQFERYQAMLKKQQEKHEKPQ